MNRDEMGISISDPERITPFSHPENFPDFDKKIYSQDELSSFARYLLFETNFFTIDDNTYLGDYRKQWQDRQQQKIWD